MNLLFCSNPVNPKVVDTDWQTEYEQAKQLGMNIVLFDYEAFQNDAQQRAFYTSYKPLQPELIVYRGWMMPITQYQKLYNALKHLNFRLINSPEEYQHCYYLPDSYDKIADQTPLTVFTEQKNLPNEDTLDQLLSVFGHQPIIVKDYVKSQKHYWHEACYIPDASDREHVKQVVKTFIEKQGEQLQGGLVFRSFIELDPVGVHPKSQMPLTREYRIFVLNQQPIACSQYWEDGKYETDDELNLTEFKAIFTSVNSHFFTVDIARKKTGEWIIIELGDGQVAEYLGETGLLSFYQSIKDLKTMY